MSNTAWEISEDLYKRNKALSTKLPKSFWFLSGIVLAIICVELCIHFFNFIPISWYICVRIIETMFFVAVIISFMYLVEQSVPKKLYHRKMQSFECLLHEYHINTSAKLKHLEKEIEQAKKELMDRRMSVKDYIRLGMGIIVSLGGIFIKFSVEEPIVVYINSMGEWSIYFGQYYKAIISVLVATVFLGLGFYHLAQLLFDKVYSVRKYDLTQKYIAKYKYKFNISAPNP